MYSILLVLHSWIRWLALAAGVAATIAAVMDRGSATGEKTAVDRLGLVLIISLDIQLVLGVLLYFGVSPLMREIRANFGGSMRESAARFYAVEHIGTMLLAVVFAHVGRVVARSMRTPAAKRTRLILHYGIATLFMIAGTPWPGRPGGRPLFRV